MNGYPATADSHGDLALKFVTVIDGAYCSAITITPAGASVSIDCGSSTTVNSYLADTNYVTYASGGPYSTSNGVNTSLVADPASGGL